MHQRICARGKYFARGAGTLAICGARQNIGSQGYGVNSISLQVQECRLIVPGSFPVYELVSLHLLPMIHAHVSTANHFAHPRPKDHTTISQGRRPSRKFHALLTSHHLVSSTKRRMMQQWSCKLNLTGFAKVGYPGIIYSEGDEEDIKEFIENVKAMQWLALRVRFVEPLESSQDPHPTVGAPSPWVELQKIAEVLSYMRKRGRETTLTNLGIGNSANSR